MQFGKAIMTKRRVGRILLRMSTVANHNHSRAFGCRIGTCWPTLVRERGEIGRNCGHNTIILRTVSRLQPLCECKHIRIIL